ncbi:MAG: hypothetical protein V4606_02985 [Patescibacteria group bacterium]
MNKYIFTLACIPLVLGMVIIPNAALADNSKSYGNGKAHQNQMNPYHQSNLVKQNKNKYNYYYASQDQQVAQLYALLAQLQAQLAALQGNIPNYQGGNSSTRDISRVITGGVEADEDDNSVWFDGEVVFARDAEARVWFEYGTNTNMPYSTASISIDGDARETQEFELEATNLDDDGTYYYRLVAEDEDGDYAEGVIKSFRFDSRNDDDDDDDDNNDWSLEIDDDMYETGDNVRVDYEVEDEDNDNWIGLYETGDNDDDYISRVYVDDEEGYVNFRVNNEGEYEFRLFDEDDDEQATSDEFEVED